MEFLELANFIIFIPLISYLIWRVLRHFKLL